MATDREAHEWSDAHSRKPYTVWNPDWSRERKERYKAAFVDEPEGRNRRQLNKDKQNKIRAFLVPDVMSQAEWEQQYRDRR